MPLLRAAIVLAIFFLAMTGLTHPEVFEPIEPFTSNILDVISDIFREIGNLIQRMAN